MYNVKINKNIYVYEKNNHVLFSKLTQRKANGKTVYKNYTIEYI